jgi:hypothetical protein
LPEDRVAGLRYQVVMDVVDVSGHREHIDPNRTF